MSVRPALVLASVALVLAGCGSDGGSTGASRSVPITAGDSTCEVAKTSFDPGEVVFAVSNAGKDTTEVYVYGKGSTGAYDKVVGEVENIAPGTSRDVTVDLTSGTFEVACKPGQKGDGVRTDIQVSGAVPTATGAASSGSSAYDREVDISARDYGFVGLIGFTGKVGEKVEFKLKNLSADNRHEFDVFGPDGKLLGEVPPTDPGQTGEVIVTFAKAGTYTFKCGIGDHAEKGMEGSFTVS
jgi:iron uptake system component EfeO